MAAVMALSCNPTPEADRSASVSSEQASGQEMTGKPTGSFAIENIPFSDADLGDFPFFNLPKGLEAIGSLQKNFDVCFFPVDGKMTPFEGKLYKINVGAVRGEEFSQRYFEKSLEDYLLSIGAHKVFDGKITSEEYDRYNGQDPNKGAAGDIGYTDQQIRFYVVRTKDKGNVYVQFAANSASGYVNVLQEKAFQQTMTKVTADEIANDLIEKGKSVLYINFDSDRSNITVDGKETVGQIAGALKREPALKIAIEGHTDNSGDSAHNKKLSAERAHVVMEALIALGIDKSRLSAKGFGADRPLATNDSEKNKAKNRRVELVRLN